MKDLVNRYQVHTSAPPGGLEIDKPVTRQDFDNLRTLVLEDLLWRTKQLDAITALHNLQDLVERKLEKDKRNKNEIKKTAEGRYEFADDDPMKTLQDSVYTEYQRLMLEAMTTFLPTSLAEDEEERKAMKNMKSLEKKDVAVPTWDESPIRALDLQFHILVDEMILKALTKTEIADVIAHYKSNLDKHVMMRMAHATLVAQRFTPAPNIVNFWLESW